MISAIREVSRSPVAGKFWCIARLSTALPPLVRVAIGCLFIASSLPKLQRPYDFLAAVYSYSLVGPESGFAIALLLPWLELVLGIVLLTRFLEQGAWLMVAVLMCVFTFARASVVARGTPTPCGCFTLDRGDPMTFSDVVVTALLLLVALLMLLYRLHLDVRADHCA